MRPNRAQAKASIPWTGEACCALDADDGWSLVKQLTTLPPPLPINQRGPDDAHCIDFTLCLISGLHYQTMGILT